jgi:hypothetical protein
MTPTISTAGRMPMIRSRRPEPPLTFLALIVTSFDVRSGRSAGSPSGGMTVSNEV